MASNNWILQALRWSLIGVLAALAWQYLIWDGPWRVLFWDESLLSGLISRLGWEWSDWATSPLVGQGISYFTQGLGVLFGIGAILTFSKWAQTKWWIWIGFTILLFAHTLLNWKSHAWQIGYLIEHSLRWTTPLWFILLWPIHQVSTSWLFAKVAIALTFIGHGLYAMGYHPVPAHFVGMMMNGFGLSEEWARDMLWIIGWLDVIAALAIFIPLPKVKLVALIYIVVWALLTALARLYANMEWYTWSELLIQWLPEFAIRWCHFLIPFAYLVYWRKLVTIE